VIILDTNVISEQLRPSASKAVQLWLDSQIAETLYLTSVSLLELLLGIELLPEGKRRHALATAMSGVLQQIFGERILPFDEQAARVYAPIVARSRASGSAISVSDGQIAAIAMSRGFSVATRDITPFIAAGVTVINPWTNQV